jgi:formate dehydrogenase subunit delta
MSAADPGDHLIRMANDIGDFFRAQPREEAVAGIAMHIRNYWTRRMRDKLNRRLEVSEEGLDELPRAAVASLNANPNAKPTEPPGGDAG